MWLLAIRVLCQAPFTFLLPDCSQGATPTALPLPSPAHPHTGLKQLSALLPPGTLEPYPTLVPNGTPFSVLGLGTGPQWVQVRPTPVTYLPRLMWALLNTLQT